MSTEQEVLSNYFGYVCTYLEANGVQCGCCCPESTFTFDIAGNTPTINVWNFQVAQPTMQQLTALTALQVATQKKLQVVRSNKMIMLIKAAINLARGLNRDLTDADIAGLVTLSAGPVQDL
jgi:hypothetical protein